MLRCTVLYPNKDGAKFDFDYYLKTHIPMANDILGGSFEVSKGLPGPDGKGPAFLCVATLKVASAADFAARNRKTGIGSAPMFPTIRMSSPSFRWKKF
jgi:uncharacterized protein (TIGR02118 family)